MSSQVPEPRSVPAPWWRLFDNAFFLLTVTPLIWAGNFVLGRGVVGLIPPVTLGCLRWLLAVLFLLPFAWPHLRRDWPTIQKHWRILVFFGVIGPTIFNTGAYIGLNYTSALNGTILQSSAPIMIAIAAYLIFGDRLTRLQVIGIPLSMIGVLTVLAKGDFASLLASGLNAGDVIILFAFVGWAIYTVFLNRKPPLHWMSFAIAISAVSVVLTLPIAVMEHAGGLRIAITWPIVLSVLYVAIFPGIVAYNFYIRAVQLVGANRAGVCLHLVPMFGSVLAILLLGESLEAFHLVGFALILSGVAMTAIKSGKASNV